MTSKREIVIYILGEVLEFSNEKQEKLIAKGYDTVTKLRNISPKTLSKLCDNGDINELESDMITAFQTWCAGRRSAGLLMPGSLAQWGESLNTETLNDCDFKVDASPPEETPKTTLAVKLSDYPHFKGSQASWLDFKQAFIATAMLAGLGYLLDVTDMNLHEYRRQTDPKYDMNVRDLYGILSTKTAGGLATLKVTKHNDTADGVKAWRDLLAYWDLTGNVSAYGGHKLSELSALEYRGHTQGGIDFYIAKHDMLCSELARANQNLPDELKKLFFLNGIKDPEFASVKDLCSRLSLLETVQEIRKKAQSLHVASPNAGPNNNRRHNNKQQQRRSGGSNKNNLNGKNSNSRKSFPSTVIGMTAQGRTLKPARNMDPGEPKQQESTKKTSFGRQYDSKTRQQEDNSSATSSKNDDDQRYQIWRPAGQTTKQTRKQNLLRSVNPPSPVKLKNAGEPTKMAVKRPEPSPETADWLPDLIVRRKNVIPAKSHDDVLEDKVADVEIIDVTKILNTPAVLIWVGNPEHFYGHMPLSEAREKYPGVLARYAINNRLTDNPGWEWVKLHDPIFQIPRKHNPYMNSAGFASEMVETIPNLPHLTGMRLGQYRQWSKNPPQPVMGEIDGSYAVSRNIIAPKRAWKPFNRAGAAKGESHIPKTLQKKINHINKKIKLYEGSPLRNLNMKRTQGSPKEDVIQEQELTSQDRDAANLLQNLKTPRIEEVTPKPRITTLKIIGMKYDDTLGTLMANVLGIRPTKDGISIEASTKWMSINHFRRSNQEVLHEFVRNHLPKIMKDMKPPVEPVYYRLDWGFGDRYDKPCDWMQQDDKYERDMSQYHKDLAVYNKAQRHFKELIDRVIGPMSTVPNNEQDTRKQNEYRIMDTVKMYSNHSTEKGEMSGYEYAYIDSGSDTFGIGGKAWTIDHITERTVQVAGYHTRDTIKHDVPIGTGITAVDLPNGETILIRANEATILDQNANTLFSVPQMLENGVDVQDKAKRHGGFSYLACEGRVLPLIMVDAMMCLQIRKPTEQELENCEVIDITSPEPWHPYDITDEEDTLSIAQYNDLVEMVEHRQLLNYKRHKEEPPKIEKYAPFFLHPGKEIMRQTLKNTTRYGSINMRIPMRQHYKTRNPILQRRRFNEGAATDTWFSTVTSYEGYNCVQSFYGVKSKTMSHYGMQNESQGPQALQDYFRQEGVPLSMIRDNAKMQSGKLWTEYLRRYWVKDQFTEPYHPNQNPFERAFSHHKEKIERVMIDSGCDPRAWFKAACHVADISNHTAHESLNFRTPLEARDGETPDISALCQFKFWELVYFKKYRNEFPTMAGNEGLGHWLGRAKDYGDKMCYYILDTDTEEIVVRSMVRSAEGSRVNKGLATQKEAEEAEEAAFKLNGGNFPLISYYGPTERKQDFPGAPKVKVRHHVVEFDPDALIDLYIYDTYTTRNGKERKVRGQVKRYLGDQLFHVVFNNGKHRTFEYEEIINKANRDEDGVVADWEYEEILDHRWSKDKKRKGKIDVLLKWAGYEEPTWEPMEVIKVDDPVTLAKYAHDRGITGQSMWKWTGKYLKRPKRFQRLYKQAVLRKKRSNIIKYQFGVRVPRSINEALKLDSLNNNTKWADAIEKELRTLHEEYQCFKALPKGKGEVLPAEYAEYRYIPLLWAFAVKFDGRHRARCVAGGHVTPDLDEDLYAGTVDLETVRIAFVAAVLMHLQIITADVGSAYIQAFTIEKVYTIAGPEWEPLGLVGYFLIVIKALYGLKSSGAMWHLKLADNLREMGFIPCQADCDFWYRPVGNHYEYIAVIVDDLLIFSQDPEAIIKTLENNYKYKLGGVGVPEYYNGADISFNDNGYAQMSAKTYIKNVIERIEKLLECTLKNYGSPMDPGDHPELDESDLLPQQEVAIYQMLIGCAQWAVTLGRFDIQYATNTLARYASMPREGHLNRCHRLFGYLKHHPKGQLVFDPTNPDLSEFEFQSHDWTDIYPNPQEYIPDDIPEPKTSHPLAITVFVDASHATDLVTRRSITGYILFVGKSVIKYYCKRQNTVETSSYGSELVAMRIALEAILEIRYKMRMMGINIEPTSTILCDNQAVIINTQFPTSSLKKKHNAVAFHKIREAVAAGIVQTAHVRSEHNVSDILTKPKGPMDYYRHLKTLLFGRFT